MSPRPRALFVGLASLLLFLVLTALVFTDATQGPDAQLALAINGAYLGPILNELMVLSAEFGREYFWVPVVGIMLVAGDRNTKLLAIELAGLFVVGIVAGEIMKFALYRPRPYETVQGIVARLAVDMDSSYPSGHALIVSMGAAFSLLRFRNKIAASLLTLEAFVVCYSRVYVGMHYPLDVLAGVFLALAIVGVGLFLAERYLIPVLKALESAATRIFGSGPLRL